MWTTTYSSETAATPAAVWSALRDLHSGIPLGPRSDSFELHGPFAVGTSLTVTPQGQDPLTSVIVELEPERVYADRTEFGDLVLTFRHDLAPASGGTRVTHTLVIDGPGADQVGPDLGPGISADFPDAMAELVEAALRRTSKSPAGETVGEPVTDGELGSRFATAADSPGLLLWRVTNRWQARMRAALKPHDLTHVQYVLLASLTWIAAHRDEPPDVTQIELAEHACTDPMMTSQVLRVLAERGLLERRSHPTDGRARLVRVTAAGAALARAATADVESADVRFFAPIGDTEGFTAELQQLTGSA